MTQSSPSRLISRSDLARLARVSPAAITKACKGQLALACDGRRVDLNHPSVVKYLSDHARAPTKSEVIGEATVAKIVALFGSVARFREWLDGQLVVAEVERLTTPQRSLS